MFYILGMFRNRSDYRWQHITDTGMFFYDFHQKGLKSWIEHEAIDGLSFIYSVCLLYIICQREGASKMLKYNIYCIYKDGAW